MESNSEYMMTLLKNLESHDYYKEFLNDLKLTYRKLLKLYLFVEFSQEPTEYNLEQEIRELRGKWKKDSRFYTRKLFYVTIFLWKTSCTCVFFNGTKEVYQFKYIWFENLPQFQIDLRTFLMTYYTTRLSKFKYLIADTEDENHRQWQLRVKQLIATEEYYKNQFWKDIEQKCTEQDLEKEPKK